MRSKGNRWVLREKAAVCSLRQKQIGEVPPRRRKQRNVQRGSVGIRVLHSNMVYDSKNRSGEKLGSTPAENVFRFRGNGSQPLSYLLRRQPPGRVFDRVERLCNSLHRPRPSIGSGGAFLAGARSAHSLGDARDFFESLPFKRAHRGALRVEKRL